MTEMSHKQNKFKIWNCVICVSIVMNLLVLLLIFVISVNSECPIGFTGYQNNCYVLLPVPSTWSESLQLCDAMQAKLAWVENDKEDAFLEQMLTTANVTGHLHSKEVWLAGTDMLLEGIWIWADSMEPVVYTHWAPNEPNNDRGQHCMGMWMSKGFLWDDFYCDQKNYPLCKTLYV